MGTRTRAASRLLSALGGAVLVAACQRSPQESPPGPSSPLPRLAAATAAPPPSASPASSSPSAAAPPAPACGDAGDVLVFASPEHPWHGASMRVVVVTDHLVDAQLRVAAPDGTVTTAAERHGATPYAWIATIEAPAVGTWHATLARDAACGGAALATQDVAVGTRPGPVPGTPRTALWFTRATWTPSLENLYSAWVEHMFDAPLDAAPTWNALHEVLRDRTRNFLVDHLGAA
ncbi:MAG TPA: hypothetical protein VIJ22_18730, partial [Polyangiaceae bacterium]